MRGRVLYYIKWIDFINCVIFSINVFRVWVIKFFYIYYKIIALMMVWYKVIVNGKYLENIESVVFWERIRILFVSRFF